MATRRLRNAARGFTLLEMLAVSAIVVIVLGFAIVRLDPSDNHRLKLDAETLTNRLEAAHDEAVIRGQAIAFSTDGQGYQFWIADTERNAWVTLPDTDTISSGRLARGITISALRVNGMPRPLGERLIFSPSGLTEVLSITLSAGSVVLDITSDALGRIEISHAL